MTTYMPHFRSEEGEAAYRRAYECTLSLWPADRNAVEVKTQFGLTYVNVSGAADAPPLVMIHGFGFSGTQWYPNVTALASDFRIYAPDVPDQFGLSQLEKPIKTAGNYAAWLGELLEELGIERVPLVGHSYGGWLATNFAIRNPERVTRLTVISPAATFVPLSWQFYVRGILGGATGNDWLIYNMVRWMTTLQDVRGLPIIEQFKTGLKTMAPLPAGYPGVFTEAEFQNLTMPVQLIIGDHEVIYAKPPDKVIEIAKRLVPHIQVACIPNGGHAVTLDQAEATNQQLRSFHCRTYSPTTARIPRLV
jgi:pimeloyl-ACP methyl ester carboxylesterase